MDSRFCVLFWEIYERLEYLIVCILSSSFVADSVRVILPGVSQNRSVARVAMELGMPIVKDPRGGAEAIKIEDCSDQEEYLKRLRDAKCSIITNTAMRVGYSEENIRKRMASERTFRAKHRPEAPDYIDWVRKNYKASY